MLILIKNHLQFVVTPPSTTTDAMALEFLNQVRASLRPARAWFLTIDPVRMSVCVFVCVFVYVCVCPPPRLFITSGMMWRDIDPYDWLNKFYSCYMAIVVIIVNERGLGIDTHHSH